MSLPTLLLSCLLAAPAVAQDPGEEAAATEVTYPLPDIDMVVRVPIGPQGPAWAMPAWANQSDASLALEKKGTQLVAMVEEVQSRYQPAFATPAAGAPTAGTDPVAQAVADAFLTETYAGPRLGVVTWESFQAVQSPTLGAIVRGTASVELPDRPDETGRLVVDLVPRRAGLDAVVVVGVATPEEALATADELEAMASFYDGPVAQAELPFGHVREDAGYELDLPQGFRSLTERERMALNGEPVGGNSGFGGALAFQTFLDPQSPGGQAAFGCVAYSADTLEIVEPEKAPRLAENYRTMARVMLKGGSYAVDGGKPIRGRSADMLGAGTVVVAPEAAGQLATVELGDRAGYLWRVEGTRTVTGSDPVPVQVATFYTAWSDVNLHCQAAAPADQVALLDQFEQSVRSLRVTDGAAHPLELGLMARYKRWWPYTHPLSQLYWLPIPIVLFAAWLANRGD
ncbi:hypothetical protein L6R53_29810 [Myxococcota bacterium]|nr:hypothetical protein [Myxococcota bacterium]